MSRFWLGAASLLMILCGTSARSAEYRKIEVSTFMLEGASLRGEFVSVEGFLLVRENMAVLNYPMVGVIVVDIKQMPVETRRMLNQSCYVEQARCQAVVKGRVDQIQIGVLDEPGIVADTIDLTMVQGQRIESTPEPHDADADVAVHPTDAETKQDYRGLKLGMSVAEAKQTAVAAGGDCDFEDASGCIFGKEATVELKFTKKKRVFIIKVDLIGRYDGDALRQKLTETYQLKPTAKGAIYHREAKDFISPSGIRFSLFPSYEDHTSFWMQDMSILEEDEKVPLSSTPKF